MKKYEILYLEAKARLQKNSHSLPFWDALAENVKIVIQDGDNLRLILSRMNEATQTIKAAMTQKKY